MYSIVLALVLGLALTGILAVVSTLLRSGPRLVRFVEIACWVIVGVAIVWTLATIGLSLVGGTTTVEVPLAVHAPAVKVPGLSIDLPPAAIVAGGADRATLTVTGLSWTSRSLLAAATLLKGGVAIVIALIVARLGRNLQAQRPFAGLAAPMLRGALALFVGSLAWSLLDSFGAYLAGQEALAVHSWGAEASGIWVDSFPQKAADLSYLGWPEPAMWSVTFSFFPLVAALALALLGLAFRAGERMQADTEGLV